MGYLRRLDDHALYRICVYGPVDQAWARDLQDFTISASDASKQVVTTLSGEVPDQAALIGLINSLYDMGHALVSVECRYDHGEHG